MNQIPAPPHRVLFLPGASGDPSFWHGVGQRLPAEWEKRFLAWPGLGCQTPDHRVAGFSDLVALAVTELTSPSIIVAQSMGGIVAIELALRHPDRITHLVLAATSGGLDISRFGAADWRADFLRSYPKTAGWILEEKPDLGLLLPGINVPTLLLWGDADPISPPAVGRYLATVIRGARLEIFPGADHGFGKAMFDVVSDCVLSFVMDSTAKRFHSCSEQPNRSDPLPE
ncbi:MAG: alpha/beta fold hydrolase [Ferrovum sp.]|nr:alpha/beta fold hydrolase [Ferrovum sp.]